MFIKLIFLGGLLALQGCATNIQNQSFDQPVLSKTDATTRTACSDNLVYTTKINTGSARLHESELNRLDRKLSEPDNQCAIIQLAIFLLSPATRYQNHGKSIKLFRKFMSLANISEKDKLFVVAMIPLLEQTNHLVITINKIDREINNYNSHTTRINGN